MHLHPGETRAVGWRVVTVLDVVRQLRDASPEVIGRPRVIAIDGQGGAGKTTLAERLRRRECAKPDEGRYSSASRRHEGGESAGSARTR
uniref:hypothetical protein n=1 Tax=Nonomuraea sp. CA-252377 TaxID=3240003 RepID=UPI003F493C5B